MSNFSSYVLRALSASGSINRGDGSKFAIDEVYEFFVSLDTSSAYNDLVGSDIFKLEFLENISTDVIGVTGKSVEGHTEVS